MSDFSDDESFIAAIGGSSNQSDGTKPSSTGRNWNCIQVAPGQSQNPVLESFTTVPWEVNDIAVDFQTSCDVGVLYLSLKYYNYRPKYIEERVKEIPFGNFRVIILLVLVDQNNADIACRNLSVISAKINVTLVLAFSLTEAAKYIETLKIYAKKGPESLKPKFEESQRVTKVLSVSKNVNSTDSENLIRTFGSISEMSKATKAELGCIAGMGDKKASSLHELFHKSFKKTPQDS